MTVDRTSSDHIARALYPEFDQFSYWTGVDTISFEGGPPSALNTYDSCLQPSGATT